MSLQCVSVNASRDLLSSLQVNSFGLLSNWSAQQTKTTKRTLTPKVQKQGGSNKRHCTPQGGTRSLPLTFSEGAAAHPGRDRVGPRPTLAFVTELGPTEFGPVLLHRLRLDRFAIWCGAPKGGAQTQKKLGPWRAGARTVGGPKFHVFFPSPAPSFFFFFSLTGGRFVEFGGVFESVDPQMCTFGPLGCRVKPRRKSKEHEKNLRERKKRHETAPQKEKKDRKRIQREKKKRNWWRSGGLGMIQF